MAERQYCQLFEPDPDCAGGGNGIAMQASPFSVEDIVRCVDAFRKARPHVHCITNNVAQHFTANVILAAGGLASMTTALDEINGFVAMSDALLINLGTMDEERKQSIDMAIAAADAANKPWALDPVFAQASPPRLELAKHCLASNPTLVRCNSSEAYALLDGNSVEDHAKATGTVFAITGQTDKICDGETSIRLSNGSALMDRVTAMGCALNALMAGFLAVEKNRVLAAASALSYYNICGEVADAKANGPGSFVPLFLDELANMSSADIASKVKLS